MSAPRPRGEYRRFIEAGGYDDPKYWSAEGWKWKESDVIDHAGMYGAITHTKRPKSEVKRREPERWAAKQEWIGHGYGHPRLIQIDRHPVVGVTYNEAEAYCKWAGGRLPTSNNEAYWTEITRAAFATCGAINPQGAVVQKVSDSGAGWKIWPPMKGEEPVPLAWKTITTPFTVEPASPRGVKCNNKLDKTMDQMPLGARQKRTPKRTLIEYGCVNTSSGRLCLSSL